MSPSTTPGVSLIDCLLYHAATRPDDLAVCELMGGDRQRELTWRGLCDAAQNLAWTLRRDFPGHTVMIALPNSVEAQVALLGSLWSGSRTFPCSPQTPTQEFRRLVEKLGKSVLIAGEDLLDAILMSFDGMLVADRLADETSIHSETSPDVLPDESTHSSILLESSGTTDLPKMVRREMSSLIALGRNLVEALALSSADRVLISIPQFHSYGIDVALAAATTAGCETELHRNYSPATARSALGKGKITVWPAVPLMFDAVSRSNQPAPPHRLRLAISAGSPLPGRIYEQFRRVFKTSIGQIYGASEFGAVFYGSPAIAPFDPASVGRPLGGVEARILDLERPDIERPLPLGSQGEIAIRTPTMLSTYLEDVEGPDRYGFLRTGDIGCLDDDGVLRLTGRVKLMIDVGANKVNPLELEALLIKHPTVAEAVVLAVPYSDTADRVKAVVLAREGQHPDPTELQAYLRKHILAFKIPRSIEVRDAFPRSPTGKILRAELQAEINEAKR